MTSVQMRKMLIVTGPVPAKCLNKFGMKNTIYNPTEFVQHKLKFFRKICIDNEGKTWS